LYLKNCLNYNRIGIVVKKKFGNAVLRNYEKRIIREFFRTNKFLLFKHFYDFIIILNCKSDAFYEKEQDYINLLNRIKKNEKE